MKKTIFIVIAVFFFSNFCFGSVNKSLPKPVINTEFQLIYIKDILLIEHYLQLIEKLKTEGE